MPIDLDPEGSGALDEARVPPSAQLAVVDEQHEADDPRGAHGGEVVVDVPPIDASRIADRRPALAGQHGQPDAAGEVIGEVRGRDPVDPRGRIVDRFSHLVEPPIPARAVVTLWIEWLAAERAGRPAGGE